MSAIRDDLFQIGWLAADVLERFTTIQNAIRSWRVVFFVHVNFTQHARDTHAIGECFNELITRLEKIIPSVKPGSKEDELAQALGHYLCNVINSVSAYEHLANLQAHHEKRDRFKGMFRVRRARKDFEGRVKEYRERGAILQQIWEEVKHS